MSTSPTSPTPASPPGDASPAGAASTGASRPAGLDIPVHYASRSEVRGDSAGSHVLLALDTARSGVGVRGTLRDAGLTRDALMTALVVLGSDLRHKSKDRTAYLAYLAKQGKKATAAIWEAQKAFLDESFADDRQRITVLEPPLTVHPDEVSLEVFSRDESAYARLSLSNDLFEGRQAAHGSTFVDLGPDVITAIDRLRSYAPVSLDAGAAAPLRAPGSPAAAPTAPSATPEDRLLEIPYTFLRGFLQVQTAATLPSVSCELAAIDLYNLLFALRTRKAKKSPRALRFELVPGAPPRMILEPWEIVIEGHGAPYQGRAPRVVRTFGRQRLLALARALPYVKSAKVHLLGPGLPVFWVLDLGQAALTLALTGWTESGWASAASFDALIPDDSGRDLAAPVLALLRQNGPMSLAALTTALGVAPATKSTKAAKSDESKVRAALKLLCLRGQALYDLRAGAYRPRDLLAQPIDESQIRYGDRREAQAHRLLTPGKDGGEVKLTKIHEIAGDGPAEVEIHGEVTDRELRRTYSPSFLLDAEGRARDASCGCPAFRRAGLRQGPCEHLLALRLFYGRRRAEEEARRQTPEGRRTIRAETRTLVRRDATGHESVYRVSLDDRVVRLVWGPRTDPAPRQQRLWFDTDHEARAAYFGRLESLATEGFIDADAF